MEPIRFRLRSTRTLYLASAPFLFAVGVLLAYNYDIAVSIERAEHFENRKAATQYTPSYRVQPGPQLVMVYVGSSSCPWSNRPELAEAVETIKLRLAEQAHEQGLSFKVVGLTNDWSPEAGLGHLRRFGRFDEVATGYGWGGTLALRYLWADRAVEPATPQVIVYTRIFLATIDSSDDPMYGERDRRTVATKRGSIQIMEWARSGVRLPAVAFTES